MTFKVKVYLAAISACILFWIGVVTLIQSSTSKIITTEQRICAYLEDHSLGATWRFTVDELGMSSDMGVAAIEDARRNTCPHLKLKG